MVFQRECLTCGAQFKAETNEETLNQLILHKETCTEKNPYMDDPNAIYYQEWLLN